MTTGDWKIAKLLLRLVERGGRYETDLRMGYNDISLALVEFLFK